MFCYLFDLLLLWVNAARSFVSRRAGAHYSLCQKRAKVVIYLS